MPSVNDLVATLDARFPPHLAEEWDNTGLLVGDRAGEVYRVMMCLTLTPESVGEAVARQADLVVSHHPLPFKPVAQLTTDTTPSRLLWELARAGVAVYSPHTAFDSAERGINQRLADGLGLTNTQPLLPSAETPAIGAGRAGDATGETLDDLAAAAKQFLKLDAVRVVGKPNQGVSRVGVACGSGASLLDAAIAAGCDGFLTGEATFHSCLAAEAAGVALVLVGHYASERFAVEALAAEFASDLTGFECWVCEAEHDPLRTA